MNTFICSYCQQERPCKGRRRLTDYDNSLLHYCATCMKNPMARRRMKLVASKHDEAFWKAFYEEFS